MKKIVLIILVLLALIFFALIFLLSGRLELEVMGRQLNISFQVLAAILCILTIIQIVRNQRKKKA